MAKQPPPPVTHVTSTAAATKTPANSTAKVAGNNSAANNAAANAATNAAASAAKEAAPTSKDEGFLPMPSRSEQHISTFLRSETRKESVDSDSIHSLTVESLDGDAEGTLGITSITACEDQAEATERCLIVRWSGAAHPDGGVDLELGGLLLRLENGLATAPVYQDVDWPHLWRLQAELSTLVLNGGHTKREQAVRLQIKSSMPIQPLIAKANICLPINPRRLGTGQQLLLRHEHPSAAGEYLTAVMSEDAVTLSWYQLENKQPMKTARLDFTRLEQLGRLLWQGDPCSVILLRTLHGYPLARISARQSSGCWSVTIGPNSQKVSAILS